MEGRPKVFGSRHEDRTKKEDSTEMERCGDTEVDEEGTLVDEDGRGKDRTPSRIAESGVQWGGRYQIWLGRVCVVKIFGKALFIGPHWYCTLIMLGVILGVGTMYITRVAVYVNTYHVVGGVLVTALSAEALLRCALTDPGILQPHPRAPGGAGSPKQYMPSPGDRRCSACDISQPKGSMHCEFCRICVMGWDHHCPWMGKCIGDANLQEFYAFLCCSLSSLAYIVVMTMISAR
mmetsp:Transcript_21019/g.40213  ORF Transcript_21019/g.40213 Transcript_21019/m.40213 type:complete len:234 (-) Transcript_21019:154-855(-)